MVLIPPTSRLGDPLGAASINIFRPGWNHAWHFDEAEYTTTLCLQQAEEGGEFEFSAPLRDSDGDLAADAVAGIVNAHSGYDVQPADTAAPDISTAPFDPGTLQIFAGRYSLHHVKSIPESCTRDRMAAVLCFATEPGVINSPSVQEMFWGRVIQEP